MTMISSANNKQCKLNSFHFFHNWKYFAGTCFSVFWLLECMELKSRDLLPRTFYRESAGCHPMSQGTPDPGGLEFILSLTNYNYKKNEKLAFSISSSPSQPGGHPGLPQQLPGRQGSPDLPQVSSHRGWPWGRWSPSWSRKRLSWCGWPRAKAIAFIVKELQFHNSAVKPLCLCVACWP